MENNKKKIGNLGENLAGKFLRNRGFKIVEKNYLKKWGEIDIIAAKEKVLHFVEVKTVSVKYPDKKLSAPSVDTYRPEDNVHPWKLKRLSRVIQTYLLEKDPKGEINWVFDVITVRLDLANKNARIAIIENIII